MHILSAELELKLRAIYYDMVEPKQVEQMVEDIYYKVRNRNNL